MNHRKILFLLFLLCSACAFGPEYHRPKILFSANSSTKTKIIKKWWKLFNQKTLSQWVAQSLSQHPSLEAAKYAIKSAQEEFLAQKSLDAPFIGFAYAPARQQTARLLTSVLANNQYDYGLITGQLYLDYTPDAFGANRRQKEALLCDLELQKQQKRGIALFLSAAVVQTAIQASALQEQLNETEKMLTFQEKTLKITEKMYSLGAASLQTLQTEKELLLINTQKRSDYHQLIATQQHMLNTLLGEFNQQTIHHIPFNQLHYTNALPTTLPSTLLDQRPDILAAEAQLKKANALIGLAMANRLPNINLGYSNIGTTATDMMTLFQHETMFWALAGVLTQPIFDAGRLKHLQNAAEAYYKEMRGLYKNTVLNAFQTVSDLLTAIHFDEERLNSIKQAYTLAKNNLHIAEKNHQLGAISHYQLLLNHQELYALKIALIQAQSQRLTDAAALFEATGSF